MKKFFIAFFIIAVLAGLGFFFGWAQMGVPPDSYGIIRSKTHGIDPRPVIPGEFMWVWYKLIPANADTAVFHLAAVNREFSARNILPSGRAYSAFGGTESVFSWEINAAISFSLRPEALVPLVTANNIGTQEELARYESEIARQIEAFVLRRMNSDEEYLTLIETLLINGESPRLEREIQEQFPFITNVSLRVKSIQYPDFALYTQAKELYESFFTRIWENLSGNLEEMAKRRAEFSLRIDELEQYGALFTRYPILIEYLALESGKNNQ